MKDERSPTITRRAFARGAAVMIGSLITAACSANTTPTKIPTVVRSPPSAPRLPSPAPSSTPSVGLAERVIYVDTRNANADDANPDTVDHPLKTIGKAATIAADDSIGNMSIRIIIFPGVYRESVSLQPKGGPSQAPIHFQAKENGMAIITGSDVWTGWRKQGTTNVYTHNWPYKWGLAPYPPGWQGNVDLQPIVRRREMIFINGDALTSVLSDRELMEGTFFVSEQSATVSIMPPPGVQVESATVEVATRASIFAVDSAQNLTVTGLVFRHGNTPIGGTAVTFMNSTNVIVEECQFLWNNWAGMSFHSDAPHSAQSMTARRNVANYNGGIGMEASRVKDVLFEDNETSYNNWRGALGGMYQWANAGLKHLFVHGGIYRRHRAVGNQAPGCWFDTDCADIEITDAFSCRNNGPGLFIEASQGPTSATNCTICDNQRESGIFSNGSSDVTLQSNIIYGNRDVQLHIVKGTRSARNWETNESLTIYPERWTMRQNIIVSTDTAPHLADIADSARFFNTFVSAGNAWFSPQKSSTFILDGKGASFAVWQSASHQDADSRFIDPRFVAPENDDFRLRDDSPLLNK
ncbi:MAG: right-handed parallel beta-helix repeat-containing protein [Thermomicrobiales bacterium]